MMIECPRCGFAQPKDQFCASCGLNIDQYNARPKPFWQRILQNSTLHLSLIGIFIVLVVGWIIYTQRGQVSREVGQLLDLPVSSREAADPDETPATTAAASFMAEEAAPPPPVEPAPAPEPAAPPVEPEKAAPAKKNFEVTQWEVPLTVLRPLLEGAERVGEGTGARAFVVASASKVAEALQTQGAPLGPARIGDLRMGGEVSVETPATGSEALQFLMQVAADAPTAPIRWEIHLILPQGEPVANSAAPPALNESVFTGSSPLKEGAALLIVVEPSSRQISENLLTRAGAGPWTVLASPEFRSGLTEWVTLIQLK